MSLFLREQGIGRALSAARSDLSVGADAAGRRAEAFALSEASKSCAGSIDLSDGMTHDSRFHAALEALRRIGLPEAHLGSSAKHKRLEDFLQSRAGTAFLDEQAALVEAVDEAFAFGSDGAALWMGVRAITLLNRERGPAAAAAPGSACELGQDDLQPMMDFVLVHAAPSQAVSVRDRLAGLSDDYLLNHPHASNALTQWDLSVATLLPLGVEAWRRASLEHGFWAGVATLPDVTLARLGAAAGAGPLYRVPDLHELLMRLLAGAAEDGAAPAPSAPAESAAALAIRARQVSSAVHLVAWFSLEPRSGRELVCYGEETAKRLEHLHADFTGDPARRTAETELDGGRQLRMLRPSADAPPTMLQLNLATGGMRHVGRALVGESARLFVGAYASRSRFTYDLGEVTVPFSFLPTQALVESGRHADAPVMSSMNWRGIRAAHPPSSSPHRVHRFGRSLSARTIFRL